MITLAAEKWAGVMEALGTFIEAIASIDKEKSLVPIERKLRRAMQRIFALQGRIFLLGMRRYKSRFLESLSSDDLDRIMGSVEATTGDEMSKAIQEAGEQAITAAAQERMSQIGVEIAFDLKNPRAVEYLTKNAALKVTQINDTTRARIAMILHQGVDEGWSYNKTAKAIKDRFTEFSIGKPQLHIQSRAHLVAITESAEAYEAGNKMVIDEMVKVGLVMEKSWLTRGDDRVSDGCLQNQADGWIGEDRAHSSGHQYPPRFPGCRCDELYRRRPTRG